MEPTSPNDSVPNAPIERAAVSSSSCAVVAGERKEREVKTMDEVEAPLLGADMQDIADVPDTWDLKEVLDRLGPSLPDAKDESLEVPEPPTHLYDPELFSKAGMLLQSVICSICHSVVREASCILDPDCAHVFCQHCLSSWLKQSQSCPTCRLPAAGAVPRSSAVMRRLVSSSLY